MAVLRFVTSIHATPSLLLDLNDLTNWVMEKGTSFGVPPLQRTLVSSMMHDGETVGADSYGNREITLVLGLRSMTADAAATQLQALHRQLDQATNLLQYTPGGATRTVFFRTFRSGPDAVQWDPTRRVVTATVMAEPFALGLREDLAPVSVSNNPATGGGVLDLTGIKGDVEVPLYMEYAEADSGLDRPGFAIGVRPQRNPFVYPTSFIQAQTLTFLADTSQVADGTAASGQKTRTTFSTTPGNAERLTGFLPPTPAVPGEWGAYRLWARVAKTVAGDVIGLSAGLSTNVTPAVPKAMTGWQMVDLGVVDLSRGLPVTGGYHTLPFRLENSPQFSVYAYRTSGSGALDIDYIQLVPADYRYCNFLPLGSVSGTTFRGVIDGPNDAVYVATALTAVTPGRSGQVFTSISGALPTVPPGSSRLVIVESARGVAVPIAHSLAEGTTWNIRYWPRYLLSQPVAT